MTLTLTPLIALHLITVLPCIVLGTFLMLRPKGTRLHKFIGKTYLTLMFTTACLALGIPATVGPQFFGHFGLIHLLCLNVIMGAPHAVWLARKGKISAHKKSMLGLYFGGIVIAGLFTLTPGRFLYQWIST